MEWPWMAENWEGNAGTSFSNTHMGIEPPLPQIEEVKITQMAHSILFVLGIIVAKQLAKVATRLLAELYILSLLFLLVALNFYWLRTLTTLLFFQHHLQSRYSEFPHATARLIKAGRAFHHLHRQHWVSIINPSTPRIRHKSLSFCGKSVLFLFPTHVPIGGLIIVTQIVSSLTS